MENPIKFVGIDAHKNSLVISMLKPAEKPVEWKTETTDVAIRRLAQRLKYNQGPASIQADYEAGPTGYGLQRALERSGIRSLVVAPALIPKKAGDRIKPTAETLESSQNSSGYEIPNFADKRS